MNKLVLAIVIIYSVSNIFGSCHKNKDENVQVTFEIPLAITPAKDTINVGDTLTLEATFPDTIREVTSGRFFRLENFDFRTSIGFIKIGDTSKYISEAPGNTSTHKIIVKTGTVAGLSGSFGNIKFAYGDNHYRLNIQFVTGQKGVSTISFFSKHFGTTTLLNNIDLGPSVAGGRKIAYLRNVWYVINDGQTYFELYRKNAKVGNLNSPDENSSETKGTYTFVVR